MKWARHLTPIVILNEVKDRVVERFGVSPPLPILRFAQYDKERVSPRQTGASS